jgi:hypothetical protein
LVSYNNDDPFSQKAPKHLWRHYLDGIPLVDVALAYRTKNLAELRAAGARRAYLLRSYYLPYIHRPVELTESDRQRYQADVTFVGHYEPDGRIDYLAAAAGPFRGFACSAPIGIARRRILDCNGFCQSSRCRRLNTSRPSSAPRSHSSSSRG